MNSNTDYKLQAIFDQLDNHQKNSKIYINKNTTNNNNKNNNNRNKVSNVTSKNSTNSMQFKSLVNKEPKQLPDIDIF